MCVLWVSVCLKEGHRAANLLCISVLSSIDKHFITWSMIYIVCVCVCVYVYDMWGVGCEWRRDTKPTLNWWIIKKQSDACYLLCCLLPTAHRNITTFPIDLEQCMAPAMVKITGKHQLYATMPSTYLSVINTPQTHQLLSPVGGRFQSIAANLRFTVVNKDL